MLKLRYQPDTENRKEREFTNNKMMKDRESVSAIDKYIVAQKTKVALVDDPN